ncbi:MAG: Gfo/Idh/MocA family protein [Saprospiraceae bacterium]|jgi:predicted dehydrogenase
MLKIGVFGAGHLGKIHLKCLQMTDRYELVGFYDPDEATARAVAETFQVRRFERPEQLYDAVDVVDIVTPTVTHFSLAKDAIERGKHIFVEKPLTRSIEEARELMKLARSAGIKVQVGHVERFNPAFLSLHSQSLNPMFVEGHRLAQFNPRGTDVSVVLDLMIHDLDIVLSVVRSDVRSVSASGVAVVSSTPDIANVRLEFENGCVANLTASRISLKQMRKLRLFQKDAYISIDFLEKSSQVIRMFDRPEELDASQREQLMQLDTPEGPRFIHIDQPASEPVNAIKMELETLAESILEDSPPRVSIEDGYRALVVAHEIIEQIESRNSILRTQA